MSTPSAKTATGKQTKTTTTTVVKTTAKPQANTSGIASKLQRPKTTASGKKVVNSHSNRLLSSNGLMRFSRGRMFHRRALYRISKWKTAQAKLQGDKTKKTAGSIQKRTLALKKKPVGGDRNGKERLVRTNRFVCLLEKKKKHREKEKIRSFLATLLSNWRIAQKILSQTKIIRQPQT